MNIGIIGAGNVGGALAKRWSARGHVITVGARNLESEDVKALTGLQNLSATSVSEAISKSDVILIATPPTAILEIIAENPSLKDKIVIDATNAIFKKPEPYATGVHALIANGVNKAVKCFNSTGFENMENPKYGEAALDMFVAGSNTEGKEVAVALSKDAGFEECYDFGGDDKVELLEQFAFSWINLAIMQKQGRDIAFKVIKR